MPILPYPLAPENPGESPFDAIREIDPFTGLESWGGRRLMPMLGYSKWQEFREVIGRAMIAAKGAGADVTSLFTDVSEKTRGRPRADVRLTRYAAYLVALEADSRKPEVALAKTYFAVRTRQAEVELAAPMAAPMSAPTPSSGLDSLEAIRALVDQLIVTRDETRRAALVAEQAAQASRVANARLDAIEGNTGVVAGVGYAKLHGKRADVHYLSRVGRKAAALGKAAGIAAAPIPSQVFGTMNGWPPEIWAAAFAAVEAKDAAKAGAK